MQLFYIEKPEKEIILNTEESKHAIKVLRKKDGDILKKYSLYKHIAPFFYLKNT